MQHLTFDYSHAEKFMSDGEADLLEPQVNAVAKMLHNGMGAGSDYLGWVDLPVDYDKEEFARIKEAAEKIKQNSEVLVVIGIGGSALGPQFVANALGIPGTDAMRPFFFDNTP